MNTLTRALYYRAWKIRTNTIISNSSFSLIDTSMLPPFVLRGGFAIPFYIIQRNVVKIFFLYSFLNVRFLLYQTAVNKSMHFLFFFVFKQVFYFVFHGLFFCLISFNQFFYCQSFRTFNLLRD